MHSVNNVDEGMIHTRPLISDVPFPSRSNLQMPPSKNPLDQACHEVRKVHKVHQV